MRGTTPRWVRRLLETTDFVPASGSHAYENRIACLRRGAWEPCPEWDELFDAIFCLFGRLAPPIS